MIAFIWPENMLVYLSADNICSYKQTPFLERSSRKTVSFRINKTRDFSESLWSLLCLLFSEYFSLHEQFQKLENIPGYSLVLTREYSVT